MDTWQSDTAEDVEGDVIEIIPVGEYDVHKAKVKASLSWILHKAYQDNVPKDFLDPLYQTGEGAWHIKPRLANLLANSEVYCLACKYMFGENASQWTGHWSIIQVLSRKGIYAVGSDSVDVTETILMQSAPFKIKAHLALIDALMLALSREIMTVERVTQSVRRFSTFNASSELPNDTEDAILFWVNKVCVTVQKLLDKAQDTVLEGGETSQKVRIVSSKTPRDSVSVPIMENLIEDMCDGCSLATLISFYCPTILTLDDVCLKSNVGIADSLYNLRLIRSFCERHLPHKTCHFTYEDLLYTHKTISANLMVLVSELFYWFEIKTLPIVTGAGLTPGDGNLPITASRLQSGSASKVGSVPISNVTKQSFQRTKGDSELRCSTSQDIHRQSPSIQAPPRMPLLHRRQQQGQVSFHDDHGIKDSHHGVQRTGSLTSHDLQNRQLPRQSIMAWQEKENINQADGDGSVSRGSNLLGNVSIDSEMNASFSSGSIDLGDLDNTPRVDTQRSEFDETTNQDGNTIHFSLQAQQKTPYPVKAQNTPFPETMELESVNSGMDSRISKGDEQYEQFSMGDIIEPLIPARLKPAKEKSNNHSKEEERDEVPRRKTPSPPKLKKRVDIDPELEIINRSDSTSEAVTPIPDGQNFVDMSQISQKKFDAFFVRGSVDESQDSSLLSHRSDVTVAESYVIDQSRTPEAARAAGIPVIDSENLDGFPGRRLSREGSVASSKSSGDFSDHESHKIHFDHKTRETSNNNNKNEVNLNRDLGDAAGYIIQKPVIVTRQPKESDKGLKIGHATNFAQIRQMKQIGQVDNSGLIYMQHGREDEDKKSSLKDAFQKNNKSEKKTTFAPLPNETTWQQNANTSQNGATGNSTETGAASQELIKIKMRLEEKRKAIERKKRSQEIQQQKMRQRLGKAAFLHVVAKPKDDTSVPPPNENEPPSRMTTSDPELQSASTSTTPDSRMSTSSASPLRSPAHQKIPRPFSRDDIQQTIENVRKKWFNGEEPVTPKVDRSECVSPAMSSSYTDDEQYESANGGQIRRRPMFDRRSTSVERISTLASQSGTGRTDESPQHQRVQYGAPYERRSVSVERSDPRLASQAQFEHDVVRKVAADRRSSSTERERTDGLGESPRRQESSSSNKGESYDEYNNSLDKLNQSLTDLQGEIMKLSLKKGQMLGENGTNAAPRSRSRSPPRQLEVGQKVLPNKPVAKVVGDRSTTEQPSHSQVRSSSEPRQVVMEQVPDQNQTSFQSHTLPRQPAGLNQNQVPQYMMQNQVTVAGPTGPVYPNQFVPVPNQTGMPPTAQQYGSYIMGPSPQQQIASPYQQSPPQMYTTSVGMYPGQQYPAQQLVSPMFQSPPHTHFQPQPIAGTYTTSVHQHQLPFSSPVSQAVPFNPNAQLYHQQHQQGTSQYQQSGPVPTTSDSQVKNEMSSSQHEVSSFAGDSSMNMSGGSENISTQGDESVGGGFFISMNEGSPRRMKNKPQLSDKKGKPPGKSESVTDRQEAQANVTQYDSAVIADFAQKVAEQQGPPAGIAPTAETVQPEVPGVGFVIGQDETSLDQSAELEMQKKKEKLEKMRQKRQEEQERKRIKQEQELNKKREAERIKQEENERRKSEEKARREQIFKRYLEKKEEDEEGPQKPEKSKQKVRPKSMFVKAGPDATEGFDNCSSTEDVSARASANAAGGNNSTASKVHRNKFIPSSKQSMRKAVSCNTLNGTAAGGDKNLAYGGMTHRRPPSPDLYGRGRRQQRSNEGSEAGSAHGSEYSGPKLFVKPSAKSNRHIITNAISHCCLAGSVNTDMKNKVLEEIAKSNAKHFIILFRDSSCGYRGLYGFDPDSEDCGKIMGVGPRGINNTMIEKYFKYNSGAKSFSEVKSTKHLSVSIDAIVLQNSVWKQTSRAPVKGYR